ncbi:delta(3,5)-Delta(2,4)-dienoyl-CoA isomerase, mitochondrial isoform X1 [Dermatophagoides farinae]|uniref:delta(3,5)-Delta(2,4)-dienoyl-CoA isomerase, mitochondrial isoform X1 n=1 Tax=Dermatophagoides farinae TaxID=6954 RepID=UPI001F0F44DA|nr:delta(3,5)-Delta(2,4)-dienoyl-CoA isomerase, mitochondrial-like isoform X2 [Dermatophagoides farinae]
MSVKYLFSNRQKSIITPLFQSIIRSCYVYPTDTSEGNFEKKHFANRMKNEPISQKRARLLYQSRKRGMLENDLLLSTFAKKYLDSMSHEELELYDCLINTVSNDWDLYYWAIGSKEIPEEYRNPIMEKFSEHVRNTNPAYTSRYADYEHIQVTAPHDHILHVELNRPDRRNAINRDMFREISECFSDIAADQQCRAVVISGTGKMFCSGIDYIDMVEQMTSMNSGSDAGGREDVAARAKYIRKTIILLQNSFNSIVKCPKPVIAAIHSGCIGAGVDLISATDIRYGSKDAYFSIREVAVGLAADLGTLQRMPKLVGNDSVMRELAYTARDMQADEAKEIGLLGKVFNDSNSCIQGAIDLARTIASRSPVAVQGTKVSLNYSRDHSEKDGLEFMQIWNMCMLQSEDFIIASSSQVSKSDEPPPFADF